MSDNVKNEEFMSDLPLADSLRFVVTLCGQSKLFPYMEWFANHYMKNPLKLLNILMDVDDEFELDPIINKYMDKGAVDIIVLTPQLLQDTSKMDSKLLKSLHAAHDAKIRMSDAIIVVTDWNHYIGKDTQREIDYANQLNKEILYTSIVDFRDIALDLTDLQI